jgi:hypothetical protein
MLSRSNVKAKTTTGSPSVGSAKRGPLGLHRARSARFQIRHFELIRFPLGSCAIGGRRDNPEDPPATVAVAVPDAASTVPAILAEGSLPSAAEAAAVADLAEFRRKAEETRELHASSPGAGEGNCRRFAVIDTYHSDLTVSAVSRSTMRCGGLQGAAPVTPRAALSGITRTMAAHSMRASSRQASTAALTSRGPLELLWGSVGYRSPARTSLQSAAASCID